MSVSKVHHCISQEYISKGLAEPPAAKCRCRKQIDTETARKMVENDEASWIVIKRTLKEIEMPCHLCNGDPKVKKCANCGGLGKETNVVNFPSYGDDIVLVSRAPINKSEKKYRPALAMKTPRVATIEAKHIVRTYVDEVKEAEERLEEYGWMILCDLNDLGAEIRHRQDLRHAPDASSVVVLSGKLEPEDNERKHQGRRHDFGRTI